MDPKYKDIGEPAIVLIEEASELIKAVTKIERFGPFNFHPYEDKKISNIEKLRGEWSDLQTRYSEYITYLVVKERGGE